LRGFFINIHSYDFIRILDDQEFYDNQPVFRIDELRQIAGFLNQLCYRLITHSNYTMVKDSTWTSVKTLLVALYRRDCRKRFCPDDHWLVDSTKMNQLIVDIEKGRKHAKVHVLIKTVEFYPKTKQESNVD